MTIPHKGMKDTDIVYFDGPDAFRWIEEAQARMEAYWDSLTPEEKERERHTALQRQAERDQQEAKAA